MISRALPCILLSVGLVFLFSCHQAGNTGVTFYPVDSLLNQQAEVLSVDKAELSKTAIMGEDVSSVNYVPPDAAAWKKELEIFYHINSINKPVNKSSYAISDDVNEAENLFIKTYAAKEDLPVEMFRVFFKAGINNPTRIEATLTEDNSMYEGTQHLRMEFEDDGGRAILKKYTITGGQEMFLSDSVQYKITGDIKLTR